EPLECIDLVLHERDKWRQNQHRAGEDLGRNLEGERLTGTGWHDADAVASGEDGLDDLALAGSKRVVPEERFEHFLGGSGGRERDLHGWTLRDQVANPWLESGQLASAPASETVRRDEVSERRPRCRGRSGCSPREPELGVAYPMNEFQRYLLDEFVDDFREGRMNRRDFVVKSIGVCGGLGAAMTLFTSVGLTAADVAVAQAAPRLAQQGPDPVTVSPDEPDISVSDVEFPTADGSTLLGYLARPAFTAAYSGIVVIHENRALLEHHKDVVRRYAKQGFVAVAPDLVSREGGTANVNPDDVPRLLSRAPPPPHAHDAPPPAPRPRPGAARMRRPPGGPSSVRRMVCARTCTASRDFAWAAAWSGAPSARICQSRRLSRFMARHRRWRRSPIRTPPRSASMARSTR